MTIKIGLIGLGFMGTTHFGIYKELADAQVVAIADIDPAKRAGDISKVAGNIGDGPGSQLDMTGITAYADAFEMIANADIDAVDICVPTTAHCDYVIAALQAGKHVFCEKPICRDFEQLAKMEAALAARKPGQQFNVGMCVRAWPEYDDAYRRVKAGELGKIRSATFRRISPSVVGNGSEDWYLNDKLSGGALLDMHLHDTDFIYHMFGQPKALTSFGQRGIISDKAVDHVITSYDYGKDIMVVSEGGWAFGKGMTFEMSFVILGEKGTLRLDPTGYHAYWADSRGTEELNVAPADLPTGWHQELAYWINCLKTGETADRWQTPESVIAGWKLIMAEEQSIDSGKTIQL